MVQAYHEINISKNFSNTVKSATIVLQIDETQITPRHDSNATRLICTISCNVMSIKIKIQHIS